MVALSNVFNATLEQITVPTELIRKLRRADEFIQLGVVAAWQTLQGRSAENTGLVLGSAYGPMETNFGVLDQVVTGEVVSPTLFSHSVFNAVSGYIATACGVRGALVTLTDFDLVFFRALQQGWLLVAGGKVESCLVLQVESYSRLLLDAHDKQCKWPAAVVCWLLESNGATSLTLPEFSSLNGKPRNLGTFDRLNNAESEHPMSAAMGLTKIVESSSFDGQYSVYSDTNEVKLQLKRKK